MWFDCSSETTVAEDSLFKRESGGKLLLNFNGKPAVHHQLP